MQIVKYLRNLVWNYVAHTPCFVYNMQYADFVLKMMTTGITAYGYPLCTTD